MDNIYNAIQNLYNMDKTTWQEVLAELYNLVSKLDNKFDLFEAKFGKLLGEQVTKELKKMYDDGSLASLINDVLLKDINTKVDTVKTEVTEEVTSFKNEVNEQLDTKASKEEIDKINSSVRLKSELMTMNDLGQDVISAITGGATVNITSIPKSNSVDIVQVNNKSKTNLYNKNTVTKLKYVDNTGTIQDHTGLCLSDFIRVEEGTKITITRGQSSSGGVYNASKQWIAKIPAPTVPTSPWTFTVPSGGYYIRINEFYSAIDTFMCVVGETLPETYYSYGTKIDWLKVENDNISDDSITNNKIPKGELDITSLSDVEIYNLFDKTTRTIGKYVSTDGSIQDTTNLDVSDFIRVRANTTYIAPVGYSSQGAYYDKNKNFIKAISSLTSNEPVTFTTPSNCYYIRLNMFKQIVDTFMCVPGTVYPSTYKSYGVYIPLLNNINTYPLQGKNIYIFGDSRTWYDGQVYGDTTKAEFRGQTCVGYQQEIIKRTKANITSFGYNGKNSEYICARIKEKDFSTVDMVILDGGVNDYIVGGTLGELKSIGSAYDITTVYGAWQSAIEHIMTSNPKCKIIVNTPFVCWNANGKLPSDIALAKKEIANLYSLDCLDLYNLSNINEFNRDNFYVDDYSLANQWRLHLNDFGNKWVGGIIANFILSKYF